MSYSLHSQNSTYDPVDLQPLFSAVATVVLVAVSLAFASSHLLGLDPLFAPLDSLRQLGEMATLGISSLLGKGSLGKVDWVASDGWSSSESEGLANLAGAGGSSKVTRRYKDTKPGKDRSEGGGQYFPGLLNAAGNLCFLNATLQSMASLPSLLTYLDQLVSTSLELAVPVPVTATLLDTLEALNTPSTSTPAPLRPVELASALANSSPSRHRLLASSDQQDAHELWGMIRDAVEEEAGKLVAAQEREAAQGAGLAEAVMLKAGLSIAVGKRRPRKAVTDPWFWLKSQRIKCMRCGYVRDTRHEGEEILMLQVPLVASCSLYDLLAEYTKADLITEYDCRRCAMHATLARVEEQRDRLALVAPPAPASPASPPSGRNPYEFPPETAAGNGKVKTMTTSRKERRRKAQKIVDRVKAAVEAADWETSLGDDIKLEKGNSPAAKMVRFARPPDVLLVHVNRSTHYSHSGPIKNSCQVTFPEYLNVAPFCDGAQPMSDAPGSSQAQPRDIFRLASLVVHYGSHSFGHYVAFRRRPDLPSSSHDADALAALPEWYRISDETVSPSSIHEVLRANPFLLFYERMPDERAADPGGGLAALDALVNGATARVVESWRTVRGPASAPQAASGGDEKRVEEQDDAQPAVGAA
ncbi:hypothetical protein Rhopal_000844-T1 [Rhodotorula paludigena]|uniref:ubiquitinyl hydrolase 1 n=1 Tax=Rhodotorula paludigena TaxID=86838 RepID=A0AAV5GEW4_9BASI|nr:hypothetical protein Rhopal_000844-T1 [Rhodotorula paludigena]